MITYNFGIQNGRITAGVDVGKMMKESVSKTSYGDTSIEDYVNDNFNGSSENKQKFIDAMKKKTTGKDYFNGLNMSAKDWESEGKKFNLSKKSHSVTESKHLNEAAETPKFSAFITNLGKYNEGELVGKWVEFPIDEDDFEEELAEIGIGSTDEFGQPVPQKETPYTPNNYSVSPEKFALKEVMDDLQASNKMQPVLDTLKTFDQDSLAEFAKSPKYLTALSNLIDSGMYDSIRNELDHARIIDDPAIRGLNDFQAIDVIGNRLVQEAQQFMQNQPQQQQSQPQYVQPQQQYIPQHHQ